MNETSSIAVKLREAYSAAVYNKDVKAFLSLYGPDSRGFDLWERWSYEGSFDRRQSVEEWFSSLGDDRVKASFSDIRTSGNGDLIALNGFLRFEGVSSSGELLRAMDNRLTWVINVVDGVPIILHEHTSVPIGGSDQRALFNR